MLPIILDTKVLRIILIGSGAATERRKKLLEDAGGVLTRHCEEAEPTRQSSAVVWIASPSARNDELGKALENANIVFIADFDEATTARIYRLAKAAGALVNAEDKKEYCDFHVPAIVRRGDLLLTVSTNAQSPRLARRIRQKLQEQFGAEWAEHTAELGKLRQQWLAKNIHFDDLAKKTDEVIDARGWLRPSSPESRSDSRAIHAEAGTDGEMDTPRIAFGNSGHDGKEKVKP